MVTYILAEITYSTHSFEKLFQGETQGHVFAAAVKQP